MRTGVALYSTSLFDFLRGCVSRICQVKASEKTEVKYMQSWEEKILIKQEGERIGLERINRLVEDGEVHLDYL